MTTSFIMTKMLLILWGKEGILRSVENIKRLIELTKKKDIKTTIILLEEAVLFLKKPNEKLLNFYLNSFRNFSNEENVDVIYLNHYHSEFDDKFEAYKNLFFINDIHFNKKGNKLIAEEILNKSFFLKKYLF